MGATVPGNRMCSHVEQCCTASMGQQIRQQRTLRGLAACTYLVVRQQACEDRSLAPLHHEVQARAPWAKVRECQGTPEALPSGLTAAGKRG